MKTCLLLLPGLLATAAAVSVPGPTLYPPSPFNPPGGLPSGPPGPPSPRIPPGPPRPPDPTQGKHCIQIGLWKYDGCNTCRCTEDMLMKCTSNVCPSTDACKYGRAFIDQCDNLCVCQDSGEYICKANRDIPDGGICYGAAQATTPATCDGNGEIKLSFGTRSFCEDGIVRFQYVEGENDRCTVGVSFKRWCNTTCTCIRSNGAIHCTNEPCHPNTAPEPPRGPSPSSLLFGDVLVSEQESCPTGLRAAPGQLGLKVCQAAGCTPGVEWQVSACVKCFCNQDGEPACTPCARQPTGSTALCDGQIAQRCAMVDVPADCGRRYSPERDCYKCKCGVGEPGDITVPFEQKCPPGFGHRANGAFFKTCAHVTELPNGDTEECSKTECDPHCIFVRRSDRGCVFCQCKGNMLVSAYEECPAPLVEGPIRQGQKVCKAPNKQECSKSGTEYSVGCDNCICLDNGVPACTRKDRSGFLPPSVPNCQHAPAYIDECGNVCHCSGGKYGCTRKACRWRYGRSQHPMACKSAITLPVVKGKRVYCHNGFVKIQPLQAPCVPDSFFMDAQYCNMCTCINGGLSCTRQYCRPFQPNPSAGP